MFYWSRQDLVHLTIHLCFTYIIPFTLNYAALMMEVAFTMEVVWITYLLHYQPSLY
jgi:hypothetical protein